MRTLLATLLAVGALSGPAAAAEPIEVTDTADKQIAEAFLKHAETFRRMVTPDYCKKTAAETVVNYTWVVMPVLDTALASYRLTSDAEHLEAFVTMFDHCRPAMSEGPDGYLGWYGKTLPTIAAPEAPDRKVDEILNSFRTADVLSRFIELTDSDPTLKARYSRRRTEYLDLIEKHLVPKWDARGCFVDLGAGGAVYRGNTGLRDTQSRLTKPHNMHSIIIHGLLSLYRATGKDEHMARAVRLGTRYKRCLTLKDGHYEWNYWDPAGAWDVHPSDKDKWKHWIGVEHKGGYYSASLSQAVELYHHGVVFDRKDMERFLKTQMALCWNGDAENPKWARVDGTTSDRYMVGEYVCPALAPFDARLAAFVYAGHGRKERLDNLAATWQGGVVTRGWLLGKYVDLPAARGGKPLHPEVGAKFTAKEENRRLLKSLAFEVTGSGYAPPQTPKAMQPMPPEPKAPD